MTERLLGNGLDRAVDPDGVPAIQVEDRLEHEGLANVRRRRCVETGPLEPGRVLVGRWRAGPHHGAAGPADLERGEVATFDASEVQVPGDEEGDEVRPILDG